MTVRLPVDEMKLMRAFARAEMVGWRLRFAGAGRLRRLFVAGPAAVAAIWRMIKRGEQLGLPASAVKRAMHAELDALEEG